MNILGISAFYHDSAASLIRCGKIVAAAQEERFTRKKHDSGFPTHAIEYCLREGQIDLPAVDYIAFYDKPFLKFERLVETYLAYAPQGFVSFSASLPAWIKEKLFLKSMLIRELKKISPVPRLSEKLLFAEHHQSHAASAFYPSPFKKAAVLTMDGVGEWGTTSLAIGEDNKLEILKEIHFPHSLGLLYSAFTYYTGFKVNSGEYKVMGLAPYGKPIYLNTILDELLDLKEDGSFRLNMDYFAFCTGLRMTNDKFHQLFGGPPRKPEDPLTQRDMDLAASIQAACEEVVLKLGRSIAQETGQENLCLAGGVALNCVANGKLLRDGSFKNIWIQPAAGDAGGSVGAALAAYHWFLGQERAIDPFDGMQGSYLGPSFSQAEIEERLRTAGAKFEVMESNELLDKAVASLATEKALGWFQGRMEFGPRALGGRSILGDPRSPRMQRLLNLKVKYRESFRPFAPSVLFEHASEWFDINVPSPYMLMVADIREDRRIPMSPDEEQLFGIDKLNIARSVIPAVTHVDYSARIQTVHKQVNGLYYDLIARFKESTGCPILINTSFNVRGEPVVCTPEDAFRCLMGTDIDALVIGNCWVGKETQDASLRLDYKNSFELD
ncbi:carbamoyltransferase family protein [Oligoflexus tunisiensis]|uniref:carbamoyltransferase family protein n=1 Tax=Oligoflexus tunisiensis TaxID=708132 RepID=UPI000A692225|nr:carbamoyltransferase [Oligoflexus tunisiensis]